MLERTRSSGTPPYTSYRTFKTFIEDLHEHGVPSRIDRSVLTRFSGVVGTQLMHALRFLGLIEDDGRPTERLKATGESARAGQLAETLLELLRTGIRADVRNRPGNRDAFPFQRSVQKSVSGCGRGRPEVRDVLSLCGERCGRENQRPRPQGPEAAVSDAAQETCEACVCTSPDKGVRGRRPRRLRLPCPASRARSRQKCFSTHLDLNEMDDEQQAAVWTLLKYFKSRGL